MAWSHCVSLFNLINFSTAAAEPSDESQATLAPQEDKKEGEVEESEEVIVQDNGDASKEPLKEIPSAEQLNALPTKQENAQGTKPAMQHDIQDSGTAERELSNTTLHGPVASGLTDQDVEKQEALAVSMSHTKSEILRFV